MENNSVTWQERFNLTTCAASAIDKKIAPTAIGVAVIYAKTDSAETIFLVIESRAGSLLNQCVKRLQTAKLPPVASLTVSFITETLADAASEELKAACREQVILASELRRELRPSMR